MEKVDAKSMLKDAPMSRFQYFAVAVCVFANIVDGYDTVSMAFAAPALVKEWGLHPEVLGVVFSVVALGMVCGAVLLAPLADRLGRRVAILIACASMGVVMFCTPFVNSVSTLITLRFLAGVMLGVLIPSLNVIVSEYSNKKKASFLLGLLHIGYAGGVVVCSLVAATIVDQFGWRSIFFIGAGLNAMVVVVGLFLLPESIEFLLVKQPRNALVKINQLLHKFGREALQSLPAFVTRQTARRANLKTILTWAFMAPTLFLTIAAFCHYFVSQFQANWTPKILTDVGLSSTTALSSGVVLGVGAALGNILMGSFSSKFGAHRLTIAAFVLCAASLLTFAFAKAHPAILLAAAGAISLFIQACYTGVMINATRFFPVSVRSTGVGFVVGFGRSGGMFGTYLAGVMMGLGWDRSSFYPVFAAVCVVGAVAIIALRLVRPAEDTSSRTA